MSTCRQIHIVSLPYSKTRPGLDAHITKRTAILLLLDIVATYAAYWLASLLTDVEGEVFVNNEIYFMLGILALINVAVLGLFHLYNNLWEYASVDEAIQIVLAVVLSTLVGAVFLWIIDVRLPIRVFFVSCFMLIFFMGGIRLIFRVMRQKRRALVSTQRACDRPRTLVVGAGETGSLAIGRMASKDPLMPGIPDRGHRRRPHQARLAHPRRKGGRFHGRHRRPRGQAQHRPDRRGHPVLHARGAQAHLRRMHEDRLQAAHPAERARAVARRDRRRAPARRGRGRPSGPRGDHPQHARGVGLHRRRDRAGHGRRRLHRQRAVPPAVQGGARPHRHLRHVRERRLHAAQRAFGRIRRHRPRHRDRQRLRRGAPERGVREVPPRRRVPRGRPQARAPHGAMPARGAAQQRVRHAQRRARRRRLRRRALHLHLHRQGREPHQRHGRHEAHGRDGHAVLRAHVEDHFLRRALGNVLARTAASSPCSSARSPREAPSPSPIPTSSASS